LPKPGDLGSMMITFSHGALELSLVLADELLGFASREVYLIRRGVSRALSGSEAHLSDSDLGFGMLDQRLT
jgi:hypothetical protein